MIVVVLLEVEVRADDRRSARDQVEQAAREVWGSRVEVLDTHQVDAD